MTTIASGFCVSLPIPFETAAGNNPIAAIKAVMTTGLQSQRKYRIRILFLQIRVMSLGSGWYFIKNYSVKYCRPALTRWQWQFLQPVRVNQQADFYMRAGNRHYTRALISVLMGCAVRNLCQVPACHAVCDPAYDARGQRTAVSIKAHFGILLISGIGSGEQSKQIAAAAINRIFFMLYVLSVSGKRYRKI